MSGNIDVQPANGYFLSSSLGGGTYNDMTGIYSLSGTTTQLTAALKQLVFDCAQVLPGQTVATNFTWHVSDSAGSSTSYVQYK